MRVRVAAIVTDADRVLLVSAKKSAERYMVPPGGGMESGETVHQAAAREVLEEAGIEVLPGSLIAYREVVAGGEMMLELYVAARPAGNKNPPAGVNCENRAVMWVARADLPQVAHFPHELDRLVDAARDGREGALYLGKTEF